MRGDPKAVSAAIRVAERRAKLLGLDAPALTKTELSGSMDLLQSKVAAETARAYAIDPEQLRKEVALDEEYAQRLAAIRGE